MRSTLLLVLTVWGALAQEDQIQRTLKCGARCSQDLRCKAKHHLSFAPCNRGPAPINSTIFHNVNISTVMECEKKQKCSLRLKVMATVQINEHLRGVSFCVVSAGMLEHCRVVTFPRLARLRLAGQLVEVQDDCFEVSPGQNVHLMLKSFPNYCEITRSQVYRVQGCDNADLRSNVPECITGKLAYTVDMEKRELFVGVSDMLEDKDYHLRLCHRWDICTGTEAYTLLKRDASSMSATLPFSSPLPCLCIEGWSSTVDALRVQVCPFRNRTDELWSGVTFDSEREVLSWEPACPVKAVITLCQSQGENVCQDLANSSQTVGRRKVMYSKVDPHPTLCMKFTTDAGSWIKCPFKDRNFPAWGLTVTTGPSQHQAILTSQIRIKLSLQVCQSNEPSKCDDIISVTVEKMSPVFVNLTADICQPNICIQARRVDVQFNAPVLHCLSQCSHRLQARDGQYLCRVKWWLGSAIACLTLMIVAGLAGHFMLTVYQRRHANRKHGSCYPFEHTAATRTQAAVALLHAVDDQDHAQQSSRDLEKFLFGTGMPVTLADLEKVRDQQSLSVEPLPASCGSPGCNQHLDRLKGVAPT
ncbi:hypothetical protein AAFF_G00078300 [Aldrovandia affinis]|uniref:Interleukin-17 receptor C/E N-terminal domain-containing protein n=1 Tax=Aldrovandia affinis TaxID=143900 RepID=A0AAD7WCR3_9TELE|nr:hypothetical protein AAFF_G00078300 [Aldrovandia affinis]